MPANPKSTEKIDVFSAAEKLKDDETVSYAVRSAADRYFRATAYGSIYAYHGSIFDRKGDARTIREHLLLPLPV